jgi:hypothetical protein
LLFLAKQGIALRGHKENEESNNGGNFLEFLKYQSTFIPSLNTHLENKVSNYTTEITYIEL